MDRRARRRSRGTGQTRQTFVVVSENSRDDLDRSVVSGIAWTGGVRTLTQGFQWAAALLVVRLLTPEDYGLVAMAGAYLGLVSMFSEFGLGAAIVQRRDLSSDQIARLGGVSLFLGTTLAALSVGVSGWIAAFFDEPRVQPIIMVLAVSFIFSGADIVPRSLLKRDLDFKRLSLVGGARNMVYAVTSLALAALGFGYWALVLAGLSGTLVRMIVALWWRRHRITWPSQLHTIRSELWFGGHVVVTQLSLYVRKFADILIVGKTLGTEPLGAYNVGWTQANIPVERVTPIVTGVSAGVLAASQDDTAGLRRYVKMFTEGIALIAFPATFGLAVVADDFVMLVFGERWAATIGPLRVLAVVAALRCITPVLSQVLIATDQAKENMQFAVAGSIVIPIFLFIGSHWGITGVAFGWLLGHPLVMGTILLRHALRTTEMPFLEYVSSLRRAGLASLVMVLVVIATRTTMPPEWPLGLRFAVEVASGAVVYGIWVFTIYRKRLMFALSLLRGAPADGATGSATPAGP